MNSCFAFRFMAPGDDKRKNLAIFCPGELSIDTVIKTIKRDIEKLLVPYRVYLIVMKSNHDSMKNLLKNSSFEQEFDSLVGEPATRIKQIIVDHEGKFTDANSDKSLPKDLKFVLLQSGMLEIFKQRKGLITSSANYHFIKPSGDHCNGFIRASNLLISSTEVSFLAISLLPYLQSEIKRIYIDTSSIAYLVATALRLNGKFHNVDVLIESFESYTVFNQCYDFIEDKNSLVVISASTSGSLARKLMKEYRFQNSQIVTLLRHKPESASAQEILFDITEALPQGIISTKPANCDFCKQKVRLIHISGDQFLPDTPKHDRLLIRKTDFYPKRAAFFKEFATREILRWNQSSSQSDSSKEHFFIDVERILKLRPEPFYSDLERAINRYVSRHTNAIISLDDRDSIAFANEVAKCWQGIEEFPTRH